MALMAQPWKHPKTGVYWFRRAVPKALRDAVGRREWLKSLHTKSPAIAKERYPAEAQRYEAAMRDARQGLRRAAADLTFKEIEALSAEWLRRQIEEYDRDLVRGDGEDWSAGYDNLVAAARPPAAKGELQVEPEPDLEGMSRVVGEDVSTLLKQERLNIPKGSATYNQLIESLFLRKLSLMNVMGERERGDFRPPIELQLAPAWKGADDKSRTLKWAFESWVAERKPREKTVYEFQRYIEDFGAALPIATITSADIVAFKDKWVGAGNSPATIQKKLTAMQSVLRWAWNNKHIATDPTKGVRIAGLKEYQQRKKRSSYTKDEAAKLLTAARTAEATIRWMVWMLAATGCRIQEVAQAFAADVQKADGVWFFQVTDEGQAQRIKTPKARRRIPLHPKLRAEGFLDYVKGLKEGSRLFPDIKPDRFGSWGGNIDKRVNRWSQEIVPGKSAHCWRHFFKTALRSANTNEDMNDYLTGHQGGGAGRDYGEHDLKALRREVAKVKLEAR